ncbi:hypothetical protein AMECASPLE_029345 [Ameca splendens]|uniref:Uncharacterized protein n=1 Tax=Ameca splendens TaxID=208324 RepID=A0ABV0XUL0_9TELE
MLEHIPGNKEGGELCHSASIEKYNAIFSKPTSDKLDGIVLTQSDYDLTRGVFLNVGEDSVCNRLPPKKSKLRRKLVFKKDNPIPAKHIHKGEGEAIHAPESPDRAPEKLTENISNDFIQNPSLDNIQQNCTSSVQEISRVRKYLTLRKRRPLSALYTRAKLVRGLMNEAALMVELISSRPGQQHRRQRVSLASRDRRIKRQP